MRIPFAFLQSSGGAPAPVYDPAVDAATGWWGTPYAAASWAAKSSAGTSGSNGALTSAGYPPIGVIGGQNGADFSTHKLGNANAISTFLGAASTYSVEAVFSPDAAAANGNPYAVPAFITDDTNAFFYFAYDDLGVALGHYDGVAFREIRAACAADSGVHVAQGWLDAGGDLHLVVDNGTPATPVATSGGVYASGGAGLLRVGSNYTDAAQFDGRIGEIRIADVDHGSTTRAGWIDYVNDKYGTSF